MQTHAGWLGFIAAQAQAGGVTLSQRFRCRRQRHSRKFFARLECELIDRRVWKTFAQARMETFSWIEGWYDRRRRHSGLGRKSFAYRFERPHLHELQGVSAMNVRMGLIRKKADWTYEAFNAYWRDHHGPLAARAPGLREYWQNPVTDRLQRGIEFERGAWDFDGFSQLTFDDVQRADHAFSDGSLAAELIADENHFLGGLHIVTVEPSVVMPVPEPAERARLLKRMSIITRLPSLSEEDFRREWKIHADLVRKMAGVSAYRQNVVVTREREKGKPCGYETLPIDGIVELWFEDEAALQNAFDSPAGQAAMTHAKSFLGEITAFLVNERQIV